jgi:hypothetical protein
MNHLEQLVSEWLQYNKYFVRVSEPVGPRAKGGYEGELDVVALNLAKNHFLHVECSLDAWAQERREQRFTEKFERGRRYAKQIFEGIPITGKLDQVIILQFSAGNVRTIGGARLVLVRELIREIFDGLKDKTPQSGRSLQTCHCFAPCN